MSYVDGFVIAVPTASKQKFIDHANTTNSFIMDLGAVRILECWGDDVQDRSLPTSARPFRQRTTKPSSFPGSSGLTRR